MLVAIFTVFGLILVAAVICFIEIYRIERVYAQMWGTDQKIPTWQRKRWAFGLLIVGHAVGFSRLLWPWKWTPLIFLSLVCMAFWLFVDAYRSFLKDIRTLPQKAILREEVTNALISKERER